MTRTGTTGTTRVGFLATVATEGALVVADFSGEVRLDTFMLRNGLQIPRSGQTVDVSDASDRQDKAAPGTKGGNSLTYRGHHDPQGTDTAYDTLAEDATGYIYVRRGTAASVAIADGDVVELYPITVNSRSQADPGDNVATTFESVCTIPETSYQGLVVAAA